MLPRIQLFELIFPTIPLRDIEDHERLRRVLRPKPFLFSDSAWFLDPDPSMDRTTNLSELCSRMLSFLARISAPFLADLTPANLSSFLASDDVVIVAQASPEDDILLESFENAAHKYHDRYSFGVLLAEGQGHVPVALRCQNNLDRLELSTTELGGVTAVDEFVGRCGARLVGELTRRNEMKYMRVGFSVFSLICLPNSREILPGGGVADKETDQ